MTCGSSPDDRITVPRFLVQAMHILIASAAAVGPSYIDALEQSSPVRRQIMVCHSKI